MPTDSQSKPSFSPGRKWSIGLNVVLIILIVFSVIGMINYLSRDYFYRFYGSTQSNVQLSPLTLKFVQSITNPVNVIIYYDKDEPLYPIVAALLNEYRLANPKISVETVDYLRDPGAAQKVKQQYKLIAATDRNLIIFECEGRPNIVPGNMLAKYIDEQIPNEKQPEFRRRPTEFFGEKWFTSALLAVTNPKPLYACMLTGHGEHGMESNDPDSGYSKFAALLRQNWIRVDPLSLLSSNIPTECNLLVIAGPRSNFFPEELEKIDQYLAQGGRLLALFNAYAAEKDIGLEGVLAKWGVEVGHNIIVDPERSHMKFDLVVQEFTSHPIVHPIVEGGLWFIRPRSIGKLKSTTEAAGAPRVEELAASGPKAYELKDPAREQRKFPLIVAVEKVAPKGVVTEKGACRIVVTGDSLFLANAQIESLMNRDFAGYAINWLLNRTELLQELGPRPVASFKMVMTKAQVDRARWLLLGAMPGSVLVLGTMVWLRRRR